MAGKGKRAVVVKRMKHVLMIAFHYPPFAGGSGIHRTLKFSEYLPQHGWKPIVLTTSPAAYPNVENGSGRGVPNTALVERAFALDTAKHLSVGGSHLRWMALPDRWISWWPAGVLKGLRLIRRYRPEVIWSTYPIATAQLIGLTLHRLTDIPWVADFRDPMTEKDPVTGEEFPSDPSVRRVNGWIERPTIEHCSRAVFTTPGTLAMYAEHYPHLSSSRWAVVPNGYDEEDFAGAEQRRIRRPASCEERIVLVHSGVLYPDARDPSSFFGAVADLKRGGKIGSSKLRIILRASGYEEQYREQLHKLNIDDIIFLEPAVPYHNALAEMLDADGLLVFQSGNCNWQIPAKAYECLRARRPIFALTDPAGDTANVLRSAGIDTIVPLDSKEKIGRGLLDFLDRIRAREAPTANAAEIQKHSRRSRTAELAQLLDSVAQAAKISS